MAGSGNLDGPSLWASVSSSVKQGQQFSLRRLRGINIQSDEVTRKGLLGICTAVEAGAQATAQSWAVILPDSLPASRKADESVWMALCSLGLLVAAAAWPCW